MGINVLRESDRKTCQFCDKPAKWEVTYAEDPGTDLYCSNDDKEMFCAARRAKKKAEGRNV